MLKVFLSYAREDRAEVEKIYAKLVDEGFTPWMDVVDILPGHQWEHAIERGFAAANVILICMSPRSVTKRGFVQREAVQAMTNLREKLEDDIYVIPVMLEKCEVPAHISKKVQYIDLTEPSAWHRVNSALKLAAKQQEVEDAEFQTIDQFRIYREKNRSISEEIGSRYIIEMESPRFESRTLTREAKELSQIFAGRVTTKLAEFRSWLWEPARRGGSEADMVSDIEEGFAIQYMNSEVLSLSMSAHTFFAGAAHGNIQFETLNFALKPHVMSLELYRFFSNGEKSLEMFSEICIDHLKKEFKDRTGQEADASDIQHFEMGAGPKWKNFRAFTFDNEKITIFFPPYQVHCYAMGPWIIDLHYSDLSRVLSDSGPHLLPQASPMSST